MVREPTSYVVYLRVRTSRQPKGGLGMAAQYAAVVGFLHQHGGTIVAQYVEAESGNRSTRPELAKALEAARKGKASLLIAKLDRLARNLVFIANLMDAGVDFVACDQPFASRLTLHILAAEAEDEARCISERIKAALQAAKARGVKLGSPIAVETVVAARAARSRYSANANAITRAVIADIQRSGVSTLLEIGKALEALRRARALCVELARVTGARPMQYRMVAPIAQSIGLDAAAADAAVALAIEQKWLFRSGELPHSIRLTDEGRHLTVINGYG